MQGERRETRIGGRRVSWRLRESGRARRMFLRVDGVGVEVVVPRRRRAADPERFLADHADWVLERLDEIAARRAARPPTVWGRGGGVPLLGRSCPLVFRREAPGRRVRAVYDAGRIELSGDPRALEVEAQQRRAVEELFREVAREIAHARVRHWTRELSVRATRIGIRDQRTRWGSCSQDGALSFNWRLVLADPEVFDYVVAHEVAHLVHLDHGPGFRAILDRLLPRWRELDRRLADEGDALVL